MIVKCSSRSTLALPVAVMNSSPSFAASCIGSTRKPSMQASSAATGSTSHTVTCAPMPRARIAIPFPTQPYPATTTGIPARGRSSRDDAVHRGLTGSVT
jgi:hypothetical protein